MIEYQDKLIEGIEHWFKLLKAEFDASETYTAGVQSELMSSLITDLAEAKEVGEFPWIILDDDVKNKF